MHSQVGVVEIAQCGGDVGDVVAAAGQGLGRTRAGWAAREDVDVAGCGQVRQPGRDRGGDGVDGLPQAAGTDRARRGEREGQLLMCLAIGAAAGFSDHDLGRVGGVVDVVDRHRVARPPVGVVLQCRGRRWRIDRGHGFAVEVARQQRPVQPQPASRLALPALRISPVFLDLGVFDHEHPGGVGPFVERVFHALVVAPPVRFVFAFVVAAGGGDHGDGLLVDGALRELVTGEFLEGTGGLVLVDGVIGLVLRCRRLPVGHVVLMGARPQPVPQRAGRPAVVVVVVLDVGEHRYGLPCLALCEQVAVLVVHDHRVRGGGDIAGT